MKTLVFTPTYRPGGLDVLEASLARQTHNDFAWVVSDQLFSYRAEVWKEIIDRNSFQILFMNSPVYDDEKRNLCRLYNGVADFSIEENFDLVVSLQDYIYLESDALEKFCRVAEENDDSLLTGVTHISRDPFKTEIADLNGKFTIFKKPFTDKPKRMSWEDVRATEMYTSSDDIVRVEAGHWEANWAAIPIKILQSGVRWDTLFDKGIAYENMDFAKQCEVSLGTKVLMDKQNVAISLPHKDYFANEREEIIEYSNKKVFDQKWY